MWQGERSAPTKRWIPNAEMGRREMLPRGQAEKEDEWAVRVSERAGKEGEWAEKPGEWDRRCGSKEVRSILYIDSDYELEVTGGGAKVKAGWVAGFWRGERNGNVWLDDRWDTPLTASEAGIDAAFRC